LHFSEVTRHEHTHICPANFKHSSRCHNLSGNIEQAQRWTCVSTEHMNVTFWGSASVIFFVCNSL